jgi:hypothetical protein
LQHAKRFVYEPSSSPHSRHLSALNNEPALRGQEAATAADTRQKKKSFTYGGGALVEETLGFSNQLVA